MGTRAINTVFKVGGESEYRAAVKRINAAIQELNSEMKLTEARFEGQENSYTALFSKQQQLERMYERQNELAQTYASRLKAVQDSTDALTKKSEELRDTLKQLQERMENAPKDSDLYKDLAKEAEEAAAELKAVETQMGKNATKSLELQTGLNKAQTEMENLGRELEDIRPLVKEAAESTDGYARSMEDAGNAADDMGGKTTSAIDDIAAAAGAAKIDEFFRKIVDVITDCVDASVEFESAMAGVFKTIDATDAEQLALTEGIKELSLRLPATTTEIAAVAEAAGQLGVEKGSILEFTETMIQMGTTTNISSEEAAVSLARLANITGMSADEYDRLGSVIVALGNSFATTETEIVEMATRLAATGELVGLSEAEIMAVATALYSLGIEAEAGGTAISKVFRKLETATASYEPAIDVINRTGYSLRELELLESNQSKVFKETADSIGVTAYELSKYMDNVKVLGQIADVSGTTAEEFVKAWGVNAVGAVDQFVTGLGKMEERGENAVGTLNEIAGFTGDRLSNAILALASSGGMLTEALDTANTAWEENSALAEEAAKRYETTESKITIMKNAVNLLKQEIGDDFAAAIEPGVEKLTDFAVAAADSAAESPALATGLAGIAGALGGLAGLSTVAAGIQLVAKALSLFGAAAGPVGIGVAALGGLAAAVAVYNANALKISDEAQALIDKNDALMDSAENLSKSWDALQMDNETKEKQVQNLIDKVSQLSQKLNKTPSDVAVLSSAVDQLNDILPGLGLTFDEQTGKINMTREAMLNFAETSLEVAKMESAKKYVQELAETQADLQFQYDLTSAKVREAMKAYDEAKAAVESYKVVTRDADGNLQYTSQTVVKDLQIAEKELEALQERQHELSDSLVTVGEDLAEATAQYDAYAAEIVEVGEAVEETAESFENSAELQAEATRQMVEDGKAAYDQALQDAQDFYDEKLEEYQEELDSELEALEDSFSAQKKAAQRNNRELLKEFKAAQKEKQEALEEALAEEMAALEAQYAEKKALIDQEYADRLAALGDSEQSQEIVEIDAEIEALEAIAKAEEEARKLKQQEDKKAALQKKIDEAKDREAKEEAEAKLTEYLAELEQKRIEEEREANIKALEDRKKQLQEELEAEAKNIEESKEAAIKGLEEQKAEEKRILEEKQNERREQLNEQLDDELTDYQDMLSDKLEDLTKYHSKELERVKKQNTRKLEDKKEKLKEEKDALERNAEDEYEIVQKNADAMIGEWHRYFDAVVAEATAISGSVQAAGEAVGEAFVAGLEKGLSGVESAAKTAASAKKLAKVVDETARDVLQVRSPSRVAMKTFGYYAEGAALGLLSKVDEIRSAADKLIKPLVDGGEIASSLADGREVLRQNASAVTATMAHASGESFGTVNNTYNITIPASDVKEFNDIVRIAQSETVSTRMGYIKR